jgi:thioredoxin reductase (NADPH)
VQLDLAESSFILHLDDRRRIEALTVVIAKGARYRRLDLPNLQPFEGARNVVLGFADRGASLS